MLCAACALPALGCPTWQHRAAVAVPLTVVQGQIPVSAVQGTQAVLEVGSACSSVPKASTWKCGILEQVKDFHGCIVEEQTTPACCLFSLTLSL